MIGRAYIEINEKYSKESETTLESLFDNKVVIEKKNNILKVSVDDLDGFQLSLNSFISMQSIDLLEKSKILVVPYFDDDMFIKYLHYVNSEIMTLFDVFSKNMNDENIKNDSKKILDKVGNKNMDTIKAFVLCNMNVIRTSEMLYLHRNSVNYRLNQFMQDTNMDYRDINTIMFLKLIMNIR